MLRGTGKGDFSRRFNRRSGKAFPPSRARASAGKKRAVPLSAVAGEGEKFGGAGKRRTFDVAAAVKHLESLRKGLGSAGMVSKYFPTFQKTFASAVPFIPPKVIKESMEAHGINSLARLELEIFPRTLFLNDHFFGPAAEKVGLDPGKTEGFYFNGMAVVRVSHGGHIKKPFAFIPLLHEWIHYFDMASGIERSAKSQEALAYGISLYVLSEQKRELIPSLLNYRIEEMSEGYLRGLMNGRLAAMKAIDIYDAYKSRAGDAAGQRAAQAFFQKLFLGHNLDGNISMERIAAAVKEVLSKKP